MMRGFRIEQWPIELRQQARRHRLPSFQRQAIGKILRWSKDRDLEPFDCDTVRRFVDALEQELKPRRLATVLSALSLGVVTFKPHVDWTWLRCRLRRVGRDERAQRGRQKPKGSKALRRLGIPLSEWPLEHQVLWQDAISRGTSEFSTDRGQYAHWKTESKKNLAGAWGLFLAALTSAGLPISTTQTAVDAFTSALRARGARPRSIATYHERVAMVARVILPGADRSRLLAEHDRFLEEAKEHPKKKAGRVVHSKELLALGLILCDEARRLSSSLATTALLFRDGVVFATLAMAPARAKNFAAITMGKHFDVEVRPGRLAWTAGETKQGRDASYPIWPEVRALIDEYLRCYRPVLLDGYTGPRLWITENGGRPLSQSGFAKMIKHRGIQRLGVDLTPHLFRDAVALAISETAPEKMEVVTDFLHHASSESTRDYRDQATTIAGAAQLQIAIAEDLLSVERELRVQSMPGEDSAADPVFAGFL
jgi:site-specific recombinase XerD